MKYYKAPWRLELVAISALVTVLCLGIAFTTLFCLRMVAAAAPPAIAGLLASALFWIAALPVAVLAGCALFTIRGYTITPEAILVHRLFWTTHLPRAGLRSARFEPDAMRWSVRTLGNHGAFAFCGFYRNQLLGPYRAFVTDRHLTVVLVYSDRTLVLSPESPQAFVTALTGEPGDRA